MSVFIWSMIGIAIWHFTIFLPDRWAGGIVGAFLAAWLGGILGGFVIEGLTIPTHNPPGLLHVIWALPGSIAGLAVCWWIGVSREREHVLAQPQTQE
jgi:hypothetical protein